MVVERLTDDLSDCFARVSAPNRALSDAVTKFCTVEVRAAHSRKVDPAD